MPCIKTIYTHLLTGCYIAKRQGNRHSYAIYRAKHKPEYSVSDSNYRTLSPLLKEDKQGRMTLNLTRVRQLHGNDWMKKQYKQQLLQHGR